MLLLALGSAIHILRFVTNKRSQYEMSRGLEYFSSVSSILAPKRKQQFICHGKAK